MNIALAQLNYHIGNFESNTKKIIETIAEAKSQGADLVVFGELAICGYPPRDFLEFEDFIEKCYAAMEEIATHCKDIAALIGGPFVNPRVEGKNLFNSAWFLSDGKVQKHFHKALLPTYDVFDEYRYFEPGRTFEVLEYKGRQFAVTICEDIWDVEDDTMYVVSPLDELQSGNPEVIINLSASPFSYNHPAARKRMLQKNVSKYHLPAIYVNHTGAQTELIFDGGSVAIASDGSAPLHLPYFEEKVATINLDELIGTREAKAFVIPDKMEAIHGALLTGISEYFRKLGFQKAILGLSGGVDSALTLVLAAQALGPENVLGVMMPSQYSSDHSISDSLKLVENLGCNVKEIPIANIYHAFEKELAPHFEGKAPDVTEENLQARTRGMLLMALSNKFGYILLNTSNKSEAAVGYGTLYGDMAGGLSVIGDVYKTEVYELCRYINRKEEIIPENILTKAPSAELRPDQKDSDSLPEYDILDDILYHYIEGRKSPQDLIEMGYDKKLVARILRMVNINEYKRHQMAPVLRVSSKAFGMGRRMPIVARYLA